MSGGILSGILGGVVGGDQYRGTGILGNMNTALTDNAGMLLGLGSGLLSGEGWGAATQGAMQGMQQDQRTRLIKQKQAEEAQKRIKAQELAAQYGLPAGLDADPDRVFTLVGQLEAKKREPKEPKIPNSYQEYLLTLQDPKFADYKRSTAGGVNVSVGGGTDRQIFDVMNESATSARSAATGLTALQNARSAIEGGGIFGAGADARLALQKLGAQLGVADPSKIVNTETFRSAIAPQVSAMMKATVGSTQISNADREFAEKAAGGSISLDEGSIRRLLDIMERASDAVLEQHQKRLDSVYPDRPEFTRERALFGIQRPQGTRRAPTRADLEAEARRRGLFR